MRTVLSVLLFIVSIQIKAQDRDNSKPTNLYSQVDNFLEYTKGQNANLVGYNMRLSYAPSEALSLVLEMPFRYNTETTKFGPADFRLRTFWVPYKDYSKTIGSFGASLDVFLPTGQFESGLGTSSWRFSPGVIMGLILNQSQTISLFPNLSYTYTTEPTNPSVPIQLKEPDHGMSFQVISSFVLGEKGFILVTPIYDIKDFGDANEDEFLLELEPVFNIAKGKFQTGVFYRGAFRSKMHTMSIYFTFFI